MRFLTVSKEKQAWELSVKMQISTVMKLTFHREKELSVGGNNWGYTKKEALVLAPYQIPRKPEWLSPLLVT